MTIEFVGGKFLILRISDKPSPGSGDVPHKVYIYLTP